MSNNEKTYECTRCHKVKHKDAFTRRKGRNKPVASWCKACHVENAQSNPRYKELSRNVHLKRTYGLTLQEYEEMFLQQKGLCAICRQGEVISSNGNEIDNLCVDHCHDTGQVRSLLCKSCNSGLGYFKDNVLLLESAVGYLQTHNNPESRKAGTV